MVYNYELESGISQMAHQSLIAVNEQQPSVRSVFEQDRDLSTPDAYGKFKRIYFMKMQLPSCQEHIQLTDYCAVWARVFPTEMGSTDRPTSFVRSKRTSVPMTVYYCEDRSTGGSGIQTAPSWVLVLHSVAELTMANGTAVNTDCSVFGMRFPLRLGVDLATRNSNASLSWDKKGFLFTPFPVYNDFHCVSSSLSCRHGLHLCAHAQSDVEAHAHHETHTIQSQRIASGDAVCTNSTTYSDTSSGLVTGVYSRKDDVYVGYRDYIYLKVETLGDKNHVHWSLCVAPSTYCFAGTYGLNATAMQVGNSTENQWVRFESSAPGTFVLDNGPNAAQVTYTNMDTIELHRCNMSRLEHMFVCIGSCNKQSDRFSIATFDESNKLCISLRANRAYPNPPTADVVLRPCSADQATLDAMGINTQTFKFKELDFLQS